MAHRIRRLMAGRELLEEISEAAAKAALREALEAGLIDNDEHLYRGLGQTRRDLPEITHSEAVKICYALYQQNPLGHRITELNRDFVVGDGITYSVSNPDVANVVDEFWHHEVNDLDLRLHDFALELGLYGELIPQALVTDVAKVVQIGYIDPEDVKRVVMAEENPLVTESIFVRSKGSGQRGKELKVIRDRGSGLEGDIFYFRVNAVSNATRGWPDLLHIADWLDAYDQVLWEVLERARLVRSFIWDVTVKGGDEAAVKLYARENQSAPKSGSVRVHNDQVDWKAVSPTLGSAETATEAEMILEHIAAGAGLPKHWLSSAEDVNRATALEMGAPTVRRLQARQRYFTRCVQRMVQFAVQRAVAAQRLAPEVPVFDEDGNETEKLKAPWELVQIHSPEISPRDTEKAGGLLVNVANALAVAEAQGWTGTRVNRQAIAQVLSMLGVDFDPAAQDEENPETSEEPASRASVEEAFAALAG